MKPEDLQLVLRSEPAALPIPAPRVDSVMAMGLRKAFEQIDRNGDGKLSRTEIIKRIRKDEELAEMLGMAKGKVTEAQRAQFEAVFQALDVDSDDSVSADEFVHFWMQRMGTAAAAATQAPAPVPVPVPQPQPERAAGAALPVPMWQDKLVVLCDLASELTTLNQNEVSSQPEKPTRKPKGVSMRYRGSLAVHTQSASCLRFKVRV